MDTRGWIARLCRNQPMNKAFADIIGLEQLNASAAVLFATRQINGAAMFTYKGLCCVAELLAFRTATQSTRVPFPV